MNRGMKYRIYPNEEQKTFLRKVFGCARFVYNHTLDARSTAYKDNGEKWNLKDMRAHLYALREQPDTIWLKDVPAACIDESLRQLDDAFKRFFKGQAKYPAFKKRGHGGSAKYYSCGFRLKDDKLWLAKMKSPVRVVWHRPLPEGIKPTQVTVSVDASGRWFVSILVDDPRIQPMPELDNEVSLHMGVRQLLTTSDDMVFENPRYFEKALFRIQKLGRSLSRKQPGSANFHKARLKLAKAHAKVADQRRDTLHKISRYLVDRYQVIRVEQWNIQKMQRKGHRKISRSIADSGWGMLLTMLKYKAAWAGRIVEEIEPYTATNKTCHACGAKTGHGAGRTWTCGECGVVHDRDDNAAQNVMMAPTA